MGGQWRGEGAGQGRGEGAGGEGRGGQGGMRRIPVAVWHLEA